MSDALTRVPDGPPREASSLTEALLRHVKGPRTSHEEPDWALLAQEILATCDRPWSDVAVRSSILRTGRAHNAVRHAVALGDRSVLLR
ncbi:MAG TPA: hypothetical protein VJ997_07885 [Longimicrobiales bacterium]|nr:hypothetical protein [Longimicrobiales bacterium]